MHWLPVFLALCIPSVALPRVEPDDDLQKRDCTQSDEILRLITEYKNRNSICAEYMSPGNQTVSVIAGTLPVPTVLVTAAVTTSTHTLRKTQVHTTTVTETALPPPPTIVTHTVDHHVPSTVAITRTSRGTTTTTSTVTSTFTSYTSITAALPPGVGRRSAAFEDFPQPSAVESMPHLLPLLFMRFDPTSTITSACKCLHLPTPTTTVTVTSHVTPPAVTITTTPVVDVTVTDVVTDAPKNDQTVTATIAATNPSPTVTAYITRIVASGTTTMTDIASSIQTVTVTTVENVLKVVMLETPA